MLMGMIFDGAQRVGILFGVLGLCRAQEAIRYGHATAIGYLSQGHLAYDSLLKRRGHILFEPCRRDLLTEVLAGLSLAGLGW
jgi:hypothetical protein